MLNTNLHFLRLFGSISIFYFAFTSCGKEKNPEPITASFQIREVIWDTDYFPFETYDTDSVSTSEVFFIADQPEGPDITYRWKIGTDDRIFNSRNLTLTFPSNGTNHVEATLVVQKKEASGNTVTTKTYSRIFYFRNSQLEGHFQGYFEGISEPSDIYIYQNYITPELSNSKGVMIISSIPKFGNLFSPNDWNEHVILNRKIYFNWANTITDGLNTKIRFPQGNISLDKDYSTLTIDLIATEVSTSLKIPIKFKGKKIQ